MIRFICFLLLVPLVYKANAQEIVNLVLVGDDGITEDVQKAHSFIVVKKYPEAFQRLDYGRGKPLQLLRTYSDSTLTVLQGDYFEYDAKGHLIVVGKYEKNQKHNKWYYYNDTCKVKKYETYDMGVLIKETNPDTIKKEEKIDKVTDVEVEAEFQTGQKGWIKYLTKNLNGDLSAQSVKGGNVVVQFIVTTEGKCSNVHLYKSVEFVLDEEAIRVIENSPPWKPAMQNGRKVNAYRRQPLTFVK